MHISSDTLNRALSSPNLFFAARQGFGVLLPIIIFIGILDMREIGFAFAAGALAIALVDQPGGTRRFRRKEMFFTLVAGNLAALVTALARPFPEILWLVLSAQVFAFSMLSVFGKRGGLVGFCCLLMMVLSLSSDSVSSLPIFEHSFYTLAGSSYYFLLSITISYLLRLHEERLTLAAAVYATSRYMQARADFYDINNDLEACFRRLLPRMISMTDAHQSARDSVLRNLPEDFPDHRRQRVVMWNIFIEIIALLDTMVATQTDYALLRERFKDHDILIFMRDTMFKLSRILESCSKRLARNAHANFRHGVKAELRAIEYEIEQLKAAGLAKEEPEIYALLIQILRRLRNATRYVNEIVENLRDDADILPTNAMRRDKSLLQFRSHQEIRLQPILNNLHWGSAIFRYAVRVTLAIMVVQFITNMVVLAYSESPLIRDFLEHSHWITITVLISMRPGFALTRQRTIWRLQGTLIGCLVTISLFALTSNQALFIVLMIACMILGQAFIQSHFRLASVFITMYVLIGFQFISPSIFTVIGARALDTVIACLVAYAFSFAFPWWEKNQIKRLASKAILASQVYLREALVFVRSNIDQPDKGRGHYAESSDYVDLQLARRNMHNAYAEFADSYARMLNEPKIHQSNISSLNNLLMSLNTMTSQINSLGPLLLNLDTLSPKMLAQFDYIDQLLTLGCLPIPEKPSKLDDETENHPFILPLKQMQKASETIRQEAETLLLPLS
ncbi:MAG: FUSC family membrane protein [Pelistega sp.]|nr:FUSC family membrane protein [Pelistega sp.]